MTTNVHLYNLSHEDAIAVAKWCHDNNLSMFVYDGEHITEYETIWTYVFDSEEDAAVFSLKFK